MLPIYISLVILFVAYGSWHLAKSYYVEKYYMIPRGFFGEDADRRIQSQELGFTLAPTAASTVQGKGKLRSIDGGRSSEKPKS